MEGGWEGVASDASSLGLSPSGDDGVSGEFLASSWEGSGFNLRYRNKLVKITLINIHNK